MNLFNKQNLKSITFPIMLLVSVDSYAFSTITLYPGESHMIGDPKITDIVVGSNKIVKAKPVSNKGIVITGVNPGDTSVKVWRGNANYSLEVHVTPVNLKRMRYEISRALINVPKVKVDIVGDNVVINGNNLTRFQKNEIMKIKALYPSNLIDYTSVINDPKTNSTNMVYLDVRIVEILKSKVKEVGVSWDPQIQGPKAGVIRDFKKNGIFSSEINPLNETINSLPKVNSLKSYLGIVSALDSKINMIQDSGSAKVLARPLLSCKSGGKASFLSGGQIPYQTVGATGTPSTEFKDYGIKLDIQPTIQGGSINTVIKSEVSSIDQSVSTGNVPGFLTRKTDTEFIVKNGETIVLSGLVKIETAKSKSGIPYLSDVPLLGNLFSSNKDSTRQSELLIFVTPYLYGKKNTDNFEASLRKTNMIVNSDLGQQHKMVVYKDQMINDEKRYEPSKYKVTPSNNNKTLYSNEQHIDDNINNIKETQSFLHEYEMLKQ